MLARVFSFVTARSHVPPWKGQEILDRAAFEELNVLFRSFNDGDTTSA
jgi:hypothetical protein